MIWTLVFPDRDGLELAANEPLPAVEFHEMASDVRIAGPGEELRAPDPPLFRRERYVRVSVDVFRQRAFYAPEISSHVSYRQAEARVAAHSEQMRAAYELLVGRAEEVPPEGAEPLAPPNSKLPFYRPS